MAATTRISWQEDLIFAAIILFGSKQVEFWVSNPVGTMAPKVKRKSSSGSLQTVNTKKARVSDGPDCPFHVLKVLEWLLGLNIPAHWCFDDLTICKTVNLPALSSDWCAGAQDSRCGHAQGGPWQVLGAEVWQSGDLSVWNLPCSESFPSQVASCKLWTF